MNTLPMVGLAFGEDTARVRRDDPSTSHSAADSISKEALAESQAEVLAILRIYGPQADHDILTLHELRHGQGHTLFRLSGSRLRTARKELGDLGLIVETGGVAVTSTGRRASVWGGAL